MTSSVDGRGAGVGADLARGPRVVVLGSIGGDIVARAPHHPAPGETVMGTHVQHFCGGKGANQAVAAARAGARVAMLGRVGDDAAASAQRGFLHREGIDISGVGTDDSAPTQTAIIVLDERGQNSIVVVPGASGCVDDSEVAKVEVGRGDYVVCQGEVPLEAVLGAFVRARRAGARTVLNLAPFVAPSEALLGQTDILVLNEIEAALLDAHILGRRGAGPVDTGHEGALDLARRIARGEQTVIITLGERGAVAVAGRREVVQDSRRVDAVDTTGAGDCFVGYLVAALIRGDTLGAAMQRAGEAATHCVLAMGAAVSFPRAAEVDAALARVSSA